MNGMNDITILPPFLLQRGFRIAEDTSTRLVFEHKGVYVSAVDQRFDGLEVYLSDEEDKGGIRTIFAQEIELLEDVLGYTYDALTFTFKKM